MKSHRAPYSAGSSINLNSPTKKISIASFCLKANFAYFLFLKLFISYTETVGFLGTLHPLKTTNTGVDLGHFICIDALNMQVSAISGTAQITQFQG